MLPPSPRLGAASSPPRSPRSPRSPNGGIPAFGGVSHGHDASVAESAPARNVIGGTRFTEAPPYGHARYGMAYWDAWHAAAGSDVIDWYMGYARLRDIFKAEFPTPSSEPEILDVGSGMSEVPACLFNDGWQFVTAIDSSAEAVRLAKSHPQHASKHEMQFLQMDVCSLDFPDECFDVVLDKATFDTLVSSSIAEIRSEAMLSEVFRVLKPGGIYLMVSHSGPARRLRYLAKDARRPWKVELARLPRPKPSLAGDRTDRGVGQADADAAEGMDAAANESAGTCFYVYLCTKQTVYQEGTQHNAPTEPLEAVDGDEVF
eukprot:gb/GFBE01068283.1/.p1 GENE.gb/GFBE01068283.1/~~gb/GFBE01068283.1/.p1  ORF type:complete len:317 (+),score=56.45 gb/GFBE01068283.1/:1-951(+)